MKSPLIDSRKMNDLLQRIEAMVPHYTPEWKFNTKAPDLGTTLYLIAAQQLEETITLLNQVPHNQFLAYLNLMYLGIQPPMPARAPLIFQVSSGASTGITLPKATRVYGKSVEDGGDVSYETEEPLLAHSATLMDCIEANYDENRLVQHNPYAPIQLGDTTENQQRNLFMIQCEPVFKLKSRSEIHIKMESLVVDALRLLESSDCVIWQYETGRGWHLFQKVYWDGEVLHLVKPPLETGDSVDLGSVRCLAKPEGVKRLEQVMISGLKVCSEIIEDGGSVEPEGSYCNGLVITSQKPYPFGPFFGVTDTWCICSEEIFSKKEAVIAIQFDRKFEENRRSTVPHAVDWKLIMKKSEFERMKEPIISIRDVQWKYFNGYQWVPLEMPPEASKIFYYQNEQLHCQVSFVCPKDMMPFEQEGSLCYGIRCEITRVENDYNANGVYMSPLIEGIRLKYHYQQNQTPERFYIENNWQQQELTNQLLNPQGALPLFKGPPLEGAGLFLQLDTLDTPGPLNILMILEHHFDKRQSCTVTVDMAVSKGEKISWHSVDFHDGTEGLIRTGILKLYLDQMGLPVRLFNSVGVWLRLQWSCPHAGFRRRTLKGIHLNGVWSQQVYTIGREVLHYQAEKQNYTLTQAPVYGVEVWINEMDSVTQPQGEEWIQQGIVKEYTRDSYGLIETLWIPWKAVDSFAQTCSDDRAFILNPVTGELQFGDGKNARKIPRGNGNHIKVRYQVTQGPKGNLPSGSIKQMELPRAFVEKVWNPIPAQGGMEIETVEEATDRGLLTIRSRGVPVSDKDFEALILAHFSMIDQVRCYGNTGEHMGYKPGHILIVAVTTEHPEKGIDYETSKQIRHYLEARMPVNLSSENITIMKPAAIKTSIKIRATVQRGADIATLQKDLEQKLETFLDFYTGGIKGEGYLIGQLPDENSVLIVLKAIEEIIYVEKVLMTWLIEEQGKITEMTREQALEKLNGVVKNGNHVIELIYG